MAQGLDSQEFGILKILYPWLSNEHLALLQAVYQTWRQLAEANYHILLTMLQGIPLPSGFPEMTADNVQQIIAFAHEKARVQEGETT